MNANFERSGTFPFSTRPADNYCGDNPTGEYVITNVNQPEKAVQIGLHGEVEYVDFSRATMFSDAIEATRAAATL